MRSIQIVLSPAAGKVLIAKALAQREDVKKALSEHTVVLIRGTTNAYLAKELLALIGEDFDMRGFFRGVVKSPQAQLSVKPQEYDVVIRQGRLLRGEDIYSVKDSLGAEDMIFKGANAVYLPTRKAGVLLGNPTTGTMAAVQEAHLGRRTTVIHPVGVEKRVEEPVEVLADLINGPEDSGLRFYPSSGKAYTELDALQDLFGVSAHIISAGGVGGYEGCTYFQVQGSDEALEEVKKCAASLSSTPPYEL